MIPPWQKFSEIPRFSIGWRMGSGEAYYDRFYAWYKALSDADAGIYARKNPEFEEWEGFYDMIRRAVPPSEKVKKIAVEKIKGAAQRRNEKRDER